jgi:8-oxo-dGTP diphosphatase
MAEEVRAAGGIVERDGRIAVVHRPKYDDWSLPKGKLERGESFEAAALREVREETRLECVLGEEAGTARYRDPKGRPKLVRFWLMTVAGDDGPFRPTREVDELRWATRDEALELLTHERDRELLRERPAP